MVGYPGSKRKWKTPDTVAPYTRVYDFFLGSGGWSVAASANAAKRCKYYGAEANPIQRALLTITPERLQRCLQLATKAAVTLKLFIHPKWGGTGTYADYYPDSRDNGIATAWAYLVKVPFDRAMISGVVDDDGIAAQILVSTYGYGANIRISGKGLNTPPNMQKVLKQWPKVQNKALCLDGVANDFRVLDVIGGKRTIALIDPPYWMPESAKKTHKALTACYPGHKPYGAETKQLYIDAIEKALSADVGVCCVAGYYSDALDSIIKDLARYRGYSVEVVSHGALVTQAVKHHHRKTHGKRSAKPGLLPNIDTEWVLRRNQNMVVLTGGLQMSFSDIGMAV